MKKKRGLVILSFTNEFGSWNLFFSLSLNY